MYRVIINFLDMTLKYDKDGNIQTNWYTKNVWIDNIAIAIRLFRKPM